MWGASFQVLGPNGHFVIDVQAEEEGPQASRAKKQRLRPQDCIQMAGVRLKHFCLSL